MTPSSSPLGFGRKGALNRHLSGLELTLGPLLLLCLCLLGIGVSLPAFDVTRFYFLRDEFSILSSLVTLANEGEWLIVVLIALFSVAFPTLKLAALSKLLWWDDIDHDKSKRTAHLIALLGKWSMADVFIIALLILSIKGSFIADAKTLPGIYAFAASALLAMGLSLRLQSLLEKYQTP
ncbi:MAG: paraquat-inducible protein A [Sphingomonadales bacterium]|jgi:paraquat-inducible protein A